jgi:hypothetical protein
MGRLSVLLLGVANAFYLPGLAPVSYCREGQENPGDQPCTADIELFVNKLTSHDSAIPFEYRYFCLFELIRLRSSQRLRFLPRYRWRKITNRKSRSSPVRRANSTIAVQIQVRQRGDVQESLREEIQRRR